MSNNRKVGIVMNIYTPLLISIGFIILQASASKKRFLWGSFTIAFIYMIFVILIAKIYDLTFVLALISIYFWLMFIMVFFTRTKYD